MIREINFDGAVKTNAECCGRFSGTVWAISWILWYSWIWDGIWLKLVFQKNGEYQIGSKSNFDVRKAQGVNTNQQTVNSLSK